MIMTVITMMMMRYSSISHLAAMDSGMEQLLTSKLSEERPSPWLIVISIIIIIVIVAITGGPSKILIIIIIIIVIIITIVIVTILSLFLAPTGALIVIVC